jgi:hypothetical protein
MPACFLTPTNKKAPPAGGAFVVEELRAIPTYLILMNLEESLPHLVQTLGGAGVSLIKPQIVHCHLGALSIMRSFCVLKNND